jgi:hypothetical protein
LQVLLGIGGVCPAGVFVVSQFCFGGRWCLVALWLCVRSILTVSVMFWVFCSCFGGVSVVSRHCSVTASVVSWGLGRNGIFWTKPAHLSMPILVSKGNTKLCYWGCKLGEFSSQLISLMSCISIVSFFSFISFHLMSFSFIHAFKHSFTLLHFIPFSFHPNPFCSVSLKLLPII